MPTRWSRWGLTGAKAFSVVLHKSGQDLTWL